MPILGYVTKQCNSWRTNVLLTQHFVSSFALGIDCSHPDLRGSCAFVSNPWDKKDNILGAVYDPTTNKMVDPKSPSSVQDPEGHGTSVSSIDEWPLKSLFL